MTAKRGFLLGKFMPLHEGHLFLIETASALVDELVVLVCTRDCEPIDGELRAGWVRDSVGPGVRVLHLHRDIPQVPEDDLDFWRIWREAIRELVPEPIDLVFASEDYVFRLADELGADARLIDPLREVMPVSATGVRDEPVANWRFVPHAVRPHYQFRACLLGPESVGKSVLCEHLAQYYDTLSMPEYGRTYDEQVQKGRPWTVEALVEIAEVHLAMRRALAGRAGPILIEDTDLIQTIAWADYFLDEMPKELMTMLDEADPAQLYLLLAPDVGWVDDGTRYDGREETRWIFFEVLKDLLEARGLPYAIICGTDWGERQAQAIAAIDHAFSGLN